MLALLYTLFNILLRHSQSKYFTNGLDTSHRSDNNHTERTLNDNSNVIDDYHFENALSATITGRKLLQIQFCHTILLPEQSSTFSGSVRGYYFQAPTSFQITGIDIPTDASTGALTAAVVRFDSQPAAAGTTNAFTTLGHWVSIATAPVNTNCIHINNGDWIGVLGYRGKTNSYGTGPYTTYFNDNPTTIKRLYMQSDLTTTAPQNLATETANDFISRVYLLYDPVDCTCDPTRAPTTFPIPTPTKNPTKNPTTTPTDKPTSTDNPTLEPTISTKNPTSSPSMEPTINPSKSPTSPTLEPTVYPTGEPTIYPTGEPTIYPTGEPTMEPTINPSKSPTSPTLEPTIYPTGE
eukprot:98433_1